MAEFKLVISEAKGKAVQKEIKDEQAEAFLSKKIGDKVSGDASANSLTNLSESGVLTIEWVENYLKKKSEETKTKETTS